MLDRCIFNPVLPPAVYAASGMVQIAGTTRLEEVYATIIATKERMPSPADAISYLQMYAAGVNAVSLKQFVLPPTKRRGTLEEVLRMMDPAVRIALQLGDSSVLDVARSSLPLTELNTGVVEKGRICLDFSVLPAFAVDSARDSGEVKNYEWFWNASRIPQLQDERTGLRFTVSISYEGATIPSFRQVMVGLRHPEVSGNPLRVEGPYVLSEQVRMVLEVAYHTMCINEDLPEIPEYAAHARERMDCLVEKPVIALFDLGKRLASSRAQEERIRNAALVATPRRVPKDYGLN